MQTSDLPTTKYINLMQLVGQSVRILDVHYNIKAEKPLSKGQLLKWCFVTPKSATLTLKGWASICSKKELRELITKSMLIIKRMKSPIVMTLYEWLLLAYFRRVICYNLSFKIIANLTAVLLSLLYWNILSILQQYYAFLCLRLTDYNNSPPVF